MKRRIFLASASTVGIVGAVSGASIVSTTYASISNSLLLKEFTTPTKTVLDKFLADVTLNIQALGLDEKFAKLVAMPVQIISKNDAEGSQKIIYKNKSGTCISLSVTNGMERIELLQAV